MSAELFRPKARRSTTPNTPTTTTPMLGTGLIVDSRIPVPAPKGFRRSQSLRLRGERVDAPERLERCWHRDGRPKHLYLTGAEAAAAVRAPWFTTDKHTLRLPGPSDLDHHQHNGTASTSNSASGTNSGRVRSLSLSLSSPRSPHLTNSSSRVGFPCTPPTTPDVRVNRINHVNVHDEDDLDSLNSYTSIASTASCEHPFIAHNGTTFSGRKMKYVVHCSSHSGQTGDEYLTPTQRAQKQIKRLKCLLQQAKQDIEQKDSDIFRLTKEVVELRVYKASLNSPEDKSNSSEAVTVRENATDDLKTPDSPTCTDFMTDDMKTPLETTAVDMQSSFADSGHFDDLDTAKVTTCDKAVLARLDSEHEQTIVLMYEKKLEDLVRAHGDETQELKQKHNDKIEELLQRLSDVNLRYCQLVPNYEQAREKIQELEKQLDEVNKQLEEQEEKNKQLYLQMYNKGMEAAKLEQQEQVMTLAQQTPARVSVSELLQQLQVTQNELENIKDTEFMAEHSPQAQSLLSAKEAVSLWVLGARKAMYRRLVELKNVKSEMDPEVTLQFLKSAIYYFLTDKENHQGHLRAIQSILGFTPSEITNIDKARTS